MPHDPRRWPYPPGTYEASLHPPQYMDYYRQALGQQHPGAPAPQPAMANMGVQLIPRQLYYPEPLLPTGPNVGLQIRDYVVNETTAAGGNLAVGTEFVARVNFDSPSVIYAITAGARTTDDTAFPVGWTDLQTFDLRFEHSNNERLTTQQGVASALAGTAARPRWVVGPGWKFDRGSTLLVGITAEFPAIEVTVNIQVGEVKGSSNVNALG